MATIAQVNLGGTDHLIASTAYGTCETAQATAAKVATIQDSHAFTLFTGVTVHIKFSAANTVANPTLNVNNTGAIGIMRYGTTAPSTSAATSWNSGSVVSFTYDGTYWQMNGWLNDNTTSTVNQSAVITTNGAYCLLHANNTGTGARNGYAVYKAAVTWNPSTKALITGGTVDGYALNAASAKAVDTSIAAGSTSANLPTAAAVASLVAPVQTKADLAYDRIVYSSTQPESATEGTIWLKPKS